MAPAALSFNPACILGIGRLTHEKGFDILLVAISLIVDRYPKLTLKIIGDGPERASLEQQAVKLGLIDKVEWLGSISNDDIPKYINAACLVVVPSRYQEPFGIVAVEAALMARPVVAANVGGLAEIVVNNETGCLVEMKNSQAFANAIGALLSQPEKVERMGLAGRLRVQNEFSLAKYVDAYDILYRQMAANQLPVTGERSDGNAA
jgi:glycosyltransferase involved in cell wall biosynthesis